MTCPLLRTRVQDGRGVEGRPPSPRGERIRFAPKHVAGSSPGAGERPRGQAGGSFGWTRQHMADPIGVFRGEASRWDPREGCAGQVHEWNHEPAPHASAWTDGTKEIGSESIHVHRVEQVRKHASQEFRVETQMPSNGPPCARLRAYETHASICGRRGWLWYKRLLLHRWAKASFDLHAIHVASLHLHLWSCETRPIHPVDGKGPTRSKGGWKLSCPVVREMNGATTTPCPTIPGRIAPHPLLAPPIQVGWKRLFLPDILVQGVLHQHHKPLLPSPPWDSSSERSGLSRQNSGGKGSGRGGKAAAFPPYRRRRACTWMPLGPPAVGRSPARGSGEDLGSNRSTTCMRIEGRRKNKTPRKHPV